jgi:hypothetical protein
LKCGDGLGHVQAESRSLPRQEFSRSLDRECGVGDERDEPLPERVGRWDGVEFERLPCRDVAGGVGDRRSVQSIAPLGEVAGEHQIQESSVCHTREDISNGWRCGPVNGGEHVSGRIPIRQDDAFVEAEFEMPSRQRANPVEFRGQGVAIGADPRLLGR